MSYIGRSSGQGIRDRYHYQATAGQTTFTGSDSNALVLSYLDANLVDVWQNGVKLRTAIDYTATSGTSIVLATGASLNDIIEIIVSDSFSIADSFTRTQSDERYPFLGNNSVIRTNGNSITTDITIPSGTNGLSCGPITVANATITVNGVYTIV